MKPTHRYTTYVGHELLACNANLFGQCGTEHHDLLMVRSCSENFLYIATHIWGNGFAGEMIVDTYGIVRITAGVKAKITTNLRIATSCRQLIR